MMRIAQLSKKLNISQTEITGFLKRRKIENYSGGNSRLTEEHLKLIVEYFRPELLNEFFKEEAAPDLQAPGSGQEAGFQNEGIETGSTEPLLVDNSENTAETNNEAIVTEEHEEATGEIEVIRAPKIKLEGLKVVGKIDLPEKPGKFKEKATANVSEADKLKKIKEKREKSERRKKRYGDKTRRYNKRGSSKPHREETYEEKLKRREQEKIRRQKVREKELREKKRQHYLKTIQAKKAAESKPKTPAKPRKSKEPSDFETVKKEKKVYKNPLRRFWAWLNGEFDEY